MYRWILLIILPFFATAEHYEYRESTAGWLILHRMPTNWFEAKVRCHLEGAVLLSPLDAELLTAMEDVTKTNNLSSIFTGISATYSKEDFFSIEGISIEDIPVKWAPGEPANNEDKEMCTTLNSDGTFANVDCLNPHPYICFRKRDKSYISCGYTPGYQLWKFNSFESLSSCYKFHPIGQTWSRAFMICAAEGGHLAIVNDNAEAEFLKKLFAENLPDSISAEYRDDAFIGIRKENIINEWITIHGQRLKEAGYESWDEGQPNNLNNNQFCGTFVRNGSFNDMFCDVPVAFICEKKFKFDLDF